MHRIWSLDLFGFHSILSFSRIIHGLPCEKITHTYMEVSEEVASLMRWLHGKRRQLVEDHGKDKVEWEY